MFSLIHRRVVGSTWRRGRVSMGTMVIIKNIIIVILNN